MIIKKSIYFERRKSLVFVHCVCWGGVVTSREHLQIMKVIKRTAVIVSGPRVLNWPLVALGCDMKVLFALRAPKAQVWWRMSYVALLMPRKAVSSQVVWLFTSHSFMEKLNEILSVCCMAHIFWEETGKMDGFLQHRPAHGQCCPESEIPGKWIAHRTKWRSI